MKMWWISLSKWMILLQMITEAVSLRDMNISVPEAVASGDTVTLACYYDLENDPLYLVRWYFGSGEFYRYVPKEIPSTILFPIMGFSIDTKKSSPNTVTIRGVTRNQTGTYTCEVSADAPSFHTGKLDADMQVVELPAYEPVMQLFGLPNDRHTVSIGDMFKANCLSGPSYPAVNFTWIVNGVRLPSTHNGLREVSGSSNESGIESIKEAWSELVINVENHVPVHHRKLIVRCETNIYSLYRGAAEEIFYLTDDHYQVTGAKVSPTTDQRGGGGASAASAANRGDPDNSALTGSAAAILIFSINIKCLFVRLAIFWILIILIIS